MLSLYGTEQVGISAEIAIADIAGVKIDPAYRLRGRPELIEHITPAVSKILPLIPKPIEHIAGDQNPVDFLLASDKTLSVKTNMRAAGKIAPQNIGQPTASTFWARLPHLIPAGINVTALSYEESAQKFKEVVMSNTTELLTEYWKNLFDCDFMIYVFEVLNEKNDLSFSPIGRLFEKAKSPDWDLSKISFTKTLENWNESCTVKYAGESIGEFQVHRNRNCLKFRFNIAGLIYAGLL